MEGQGPHSNRPDEPESLVIEAKLPESAMAKIQEAELDRRDSPSLSLGKRHQVSVLIFAALLGVGSWLLERSSWGLLFRERVEMPLEYSARKLLGHDVKISDRLKIILFEDSAVARLKKSELSLNEWITLFERLDQSEPTAIYIDKIFGIVPQHELKESNFEVRLSQIKTPIVVGSFTNANKISGRAPIVGERADLRPPPLANDIEMDAVQLLDQRENWIYGPDPALLPHFKIGHLLTFGERYWAPIIATKDRAFLRALGAVAGEIQVESPNALRIGGNLFHTQDGKIPLNYVDPAGFFANATAVHHLLGDSGMNTIAKKYKKGDAIFIVPLAYTGNADFKPSPRGRILGAMLPGSVLNAVLTGDTLREIAGLDMALLLAGAVGGGAVVYLGPIASWFVLISGSLLSAGMGILLFSFVGITIPWLQISLTLLAGGLLSIASRSRLERKKEQALRQYEFTHRAMIAEKALAQAKEEVLLKEKREAALIAAAFQPKAAPEQWGNLEVSVFHHCFDAASGDWFFLEESKDGNFRHVVLCDISGHGVQAAIVVSTCRTVLSMILHDTPEVLASKDFVFIFARTLNKVLVEQGSGGHCCTFAGVSFDAKSQECHYLVCGHPPLLLWEGKLDVGQEKKVTKKLQSKGSILGFMPEFEANLQSVPFPPGASIAVYSDGCDLNTKWRFYNKFCESEQSWQGRAHLLYQAFWAEQAKKGSLPDDDATVLLFRSKA